MLPVLTFVFCSDDHAWARTQDSMTVQLEKFASLPAAEQVAIVFKEHLEGRTFLFWRREPRVGLTAAEARLFGEQEILINSPDTKINDVLAVEAQSSDIEGAIYAIYLLCMRARFVPGSEFLIKQVNAFSWSRAARPGRTSPFAPDLAKVGNEGRRVVEAAIASSNPKLRRAAKLHSFAVLSDLASIPAVELVNQWRFEIHKERPCFSYGAGFDESEQLIFLLEQSLTAKGLESVRLRIVSAEG